MKTLNDYLLSVLLLMSSSLFGQNNSIEKYISNLPSEIKRNSSIPQEYKVTLKWQNLDAINGNKLNCNAAQAEYIVGLDSGLVKWENVCISSIEDFKQPIGKGEKLHTFNGFTYKPGIDFLKKNFYQNIDPEQRDLAKWLVSDAMQMHGMASMFFDSLTFNEEYYPEMMNNFNIQFQDWVLFRSTYQKIIWSGISEYNHEVCAIVKFESLYNPLEMETPGMSFKGRSLYWGEFWISLEDKQVEYSTMVEDVVIKLKMASSSQEQIIDLQREIIFEKIQ